MAVGFFSKALKAVILNTVCAWALLIFVILVTVKPAAAVDVQTLPRGVRMSSARFGVISGLNHTWREDGKLYDLGETRSVTFDAETLARVNTQARALVAALDRFGSHSLGQKLQLGTLNVSTLPLVTYFAPVLAYGYSDRLTIGIGIPVVRYSNKMSLSATSSNLDFYRQQLGGRASQELDEVLNINLVSETQRVLAEKGYRELSSREQSFIGDVQLAMLHRLSDWGSWALLHQWAFTLPTGPKDDPDDLMALNAFGRASIEGTLTAGRTIAPRWMVLPYASIMLPVPDRTVKRVPKNEDDSIPDPDTKTEVLRMIAPTASFGTQLRWDLDDSWSLKAGAEAAAKGRDYYSGAGRTDLLGRETNSAVLRAMGGITFSTVEDYKQQRAKIPTRVSLEVTDTVVGRNIERQLRTDLAAVLFF